MFYKKFMSTNPASETIVCNITVRWTNGLYCPEILIKYLINEKSKVQC